MTNKPTDEQATPPQSLYLQDPAEGSANNWVFKQRSKPSDIEYVPAARVAEAVEDFRRRAIEAAKKLQIGGLARTHVYTMLQNLKGEKQ